MKKNSSTKFAHAFLRWSRSTLIDHHDEIQVSLPLIDAWCVLHFSKRKTCEMESVKVIFPFVKTLIRIQRLNLGPRLKSISVD